jgi:hypothetical protein
MNNMKKLAFAVFAVVGVAGCASIQVADRAGVEAAPATVAEVQVLRPTQNYSNLGGYRLRRFAVTTL